MSNEKIQLSPENEQCEDIFKRTHKRLEDGEERLAEAYKEFMETYEKLGHMEKITGETIENENAWYLPHHAVVQNDPWKSCLNNYLHTGPSLQTDLSLILTNWRKYRVAFTVDVVKMFRQIMVHPADRDCQRILWASSLSDQAVEYRLNTVTYGTACAPYLAIRVLQELARTTKKLPLGAKCLTHNTYVDDVFSGADNLVGAKAKRNELITLLQSAGMELNKWAANDQSLDPNSAIDSNKLAKLIDELSPIKTLGVQWLPSEDMFGFNIDLSGCNSQSPTKRSVLSSIAKLFDPLGILSPIIVVAKIIMQDIWINKSDMGRTITCRYRKAINYIL
ncbi:uncharacterized protein [Prorops nasuta]|uniref:uncharacterized protein n=1 Tax=Prorops nasuta TaxID=863751 RepID=UPI0034CD9210